jgi:hypothetical protein
MGKITSDPFTAPETVDLAGPATPIWAYHLLGASGSVTLQGFFVNNSGTQDTPSDSVTIDDAAGKTMTEIYQEITGVADANIIPGVVGFVGKTSRRPPRQFQRSVRRRRPGLSCRRELPCSGGG